MAELKGMRELSDDEVKMMNVIADLGNQFGELINSLEEPGYPMNDKTGVQDSEFIADPRWLAIGKTHLQTGIMCLKRAIGKPDNF